MYFSIELITDGGIGLYPDSVNFYQEYPVDYNKTIQRGSTYKFADEDRQMRLSRYLSMRIDRLTSQEDEQLITWTWEAALSSAYDGVILSASFNVELLHAPSLVSATVT
mgnify:CR=1 FL=1